MAGTIATRQIQQQSRRLLPWITALAIGLCALLLLERFSAALIQLAAHSAETAPWRRLAVRLLQSLPDGCYLLALWSVRRALTALACGELYAPTLTAMLDRVGLMLAAGASIGLLVPAATRLLGDGPDYWIAVDISAGVLIALGLSIRIIARLLRHAAAQQAELDGIF
jgi:hypothetical protein